MRQVQDALVVGVGVDGGHEPAPDPEPLVEDLGERREAVGRARRVGEDRVLLRVVGPVVDAHADGEIGALGGCGDDHFLRAGLEVLRRLVAIGEEAAALEDEVDAELLPREPGGIPLGEDAHLPPVDDEGVALGADVAREHPVHGIELEEVGERLRVGDVVDGDELERGLVETGPQHVPADAAETVDADADRRHGRPPRERGRTPSGARQTEIFHIPCRPGRVKVKRFVAFVTFDCPGGVG